MSNSRATKRQRTDPPAGPLPGQPTGQPAGQPTGQPVLQQEPVKSTCSSTSQFSVDLTIMTCIFGFLECNTTIFWNQLDNLCLNCTCRRGGYGIFVALITSNATGYC